jgi:hypothetical protein
MLKCYNSEESFIGHLCYWWKESINQVKIFIGQKVLGFSQNPVPFAQKSVGFGRKAPPFIKVP